MSDNSSNDAFSPIPFLRLDRVLKEYGGEIETAVAETVASGRYLQGSRVRDFENALISQCGARHCVAVSNGLDALRLMVRAYIDLGRIKPGDEVLYPANTYIASVLPLTEFGLVPVGVEPSETDFNIDFTHLESRITDRTRAVMLVHLYGNPAWDADVCRRLHERGIIIWEDNAQAIGAESPVSGLHGSNRTGSLGDAAAFSFYPTKNIGALGDAGALTTSDSEVADRVRTLAQYGSDRRYHNITQGYNCRMDEIQAAVLIVKLKRLDSVSRRRAEVAALYSDLIANPAVKLPAILTDRRQVWHQYVVMCEDRDSLKDHLASAGIATDIHYAVPPHRQPCYSGLLRGDFPRTDRMADRILSLPTAGITDDEIRRVAAAVNSFQRPQNDTRPK